MEVVYDLREDAEGIAQMQRQALLKDRGLRVTHGLVGSPEWWAQIKSGALPLKTITGVVSGFWPGQGGGGPAEFQIKEHDGTLSQWMCEMEPAPANRQFVLGRPVMIEYVVQEFKTEVCGSHETKVPVSIALY
jgi:hypothetical protein